VLTVTTAVTPGVKSSRTTAPDGLIVALPEVVVAVHVKFGSKLVILNLKPV
jgi:hypothetical protein